MTLEDQGAQGEPAPYGGLLPPDFDFGEGGAPEWLAPVLDALGERATANTKRLEDSIRGLRADSIRNRKRIKARAPSPGPESGPGDGGANVEPSDGDQGPELSRREKRAFDRLLASLPEADQEAIDDAIDGGMSLEHAKAWAQRLQARAPESGPSKTPTGRAGSAAVKQVPQHPKTFEQYAKIVKSDPKRTRELREDPTFDPSKLKRT